MILESLKENGKAQPFIESMDHAIYDDGGGQVNALYKYNS